MNENISYTQVPWDEFRQNMGDEATIMNRWFNEVGYHVDIAALRREFPWLATLEQALRSEDWEARMAEMHVGAGNS